MGAANDRSSRVTVLIVRPPEKPLDVLENDLASAGFGVVVRTDLREALDVLQRAARIDVVLTDTALPDTNWSDFIDIIKQEPPSTPVIVCSPRPSPELRDQVRERGAYYIEVEPYHPIAVQMLIRTALARNEAQRHGGASFYGRPSWKSHKPRGVKTARRLKFAATLLTVACWLGCGGRQSASGFRLPENGDPGRGRTAFVELQCHQCHTVPGVDLPAVSAPAGPTLGGRVTEVRTDGYLVTSIIHPSHRKRYRASAAPGVAEMPDYTDKITVRQLVDLVAFLQAHYEVLPPPVTNY